MRTKTAWAGWGGDSRQGPEAWENIRNVWALGKPRSRGSHMDEAGF